MTHDPSKHPTTDQRPDFIEDLRSQLHAGAAGIGARRERAQRITLGTVMVTVLVAIGFGLLALDGEPSDTSEASDTVDTSDAVDTSDISDTAQPAESIEVENGPEDGQANHLMWEEAVTLIGGETTPGLFWTGDEVLVIRTQNGGEDLIGERWDPTTNTVQRMSASGLNWRASPAMAWTGTELLIIGGSNGPGLNKVGAAYDPLEDAWRDLPEPPGAVDAWENAVGGPAVWTGSEMIIWQAALAFDPAADTWRAIEEAPLSPRAWPATVWAGTHLLVWGGCHLEQDQCDEANRGLLDDGALYDPATDSWTMLPDSPLIPATHMVAAWTGTEVIIAITDPGDLPGALTAGFNPSTSAWTPYSASPLSPRRYAAGVWAGDQLVIWGGSPFGGDSGFNQGVAFHPSSDRWAMLDEGPGPGRSLHSMIYTGDVTYISAIRGISPPLQLRVGGASSRDESFVCPVSVPPEPAFVPPEPWPVTPTSERHAWIGDDDLWTVIDRGGRGGRKSVWWSANFPGGATEERPEIRVVYRRLDVDTDEPDIIFDSPGTNAFTEADQWFMINGLEPDETGCWEGTATYKGATLSYIFET